MNHILSSVLVVLCTGLITLTSAQATSGSGSTTRYWDCCKGSCSWPGKADVSSPVETCDIHDSPLADPNAQSGCNGGSAYMCSSQQPWAVNDTFAYGFAAVSIPGGSESTWCCACYELTFTSTSIAGKKMIVQATNTGADLAEGQFDLAMPGGGVGIYNGCTQEWGAPSSGWGQQYGGLTSDTCPDLPSALQPGCEWRFGDFFENADNPTVDWRQVTCPKALTDKTGCVRAGETPSDGGSGDVVSSSSTVQSSTAVQASTTSRASVSSTSVSSPVALSSTSSRRRRTRKHSVSSKATVSTDSTVAPTTVSVTTSPANLDPSQPAAHSPKCSDEEI